MIQIRHTKNKFFAANVHEIVKLEPKPSIAEKVEAHEKQVPLVNAIKLSLLSLAR